jgi:hypothetical protein
MSDYDTRIRALEKYGMQAAGKLVSDHKELFLSVSEKDAFEKIVALTRLRETIEPPASEDEAYKLLESLLAELLYDGRVKPIHNLSTYGRESFHYLIALHENPNPVKSTDPNDSYADVIQLYRTDMANFLKRRATDAEFLRRSNEANSLRIL